MSIRILVGDCRASMATLPAESVQTCVTSPPYWGLRDYGVDGQLGLEETPEAYVAGMVAVFREVRRVLRDDGTLFLNIGDSYFGSNQTGGTNSKEGSPSRAGRMFSRGAAQRARPCGNDDTAPQGSPARGCASSRLCGACRAVLSGDSVRTDAPLPPTPDDGSHDPIPARTGSVPYRPPTSGSATPTQTRRSDDATQGLAQAASRGDVLPHASPESTSHVSSLRSPGACSHCDSCGACREVLRSSSPDALACARTGWRLDTADTALRDTGENTSGMDALGLAYPHSTTRHRHGSNLKPKDLVGIPWRVAFALQADGWYLRSDIIWHKPNPMPESVTDRPTKSHEYVFLLSKSERYAYDAAAIKERGVDSGEDTSDEDLRNWDGRRDGTVPGKGEAHATGTRSGANLSRAYAGVNWAERGRNARTVWSITTQPFSGAHFATMPPALAERCILAGCPEGLANVVLDPFGGAGTTGLVAQRLGRSAVLCELNESYAQMAAKRIREDAPMFSAVSVEGSQ